MPISLSIPFGEYMNFTGPFKGLDTMKLEYENGPYGLDRITADDGTVFYLNSNGVFDTYGKKLFNPPSDLFIAGQEMARNGDEFPIDGTNDLKLGWLDYTQTTQRHERLLAKALNK